MRAQRPAARPLATPRPVRVKALLDRGWRSLAALLVQTALSRLIVPGQARILDPFLLVVVYCGAHGGETHGMLAGAAAGWVQDVHFGGPRARALRRSPRSLVGFGGRARRHALPARGAGGARLLVLFAGHGRGRAALRAAGRRSSTSRRYDAGPLGAARARATLNAVVGVRRSSSSWTAALRAARRGREDLRGPARGCSAASACMQVDGRRCCGLLVVHFWHLQVRARALLPRAGREQPHPRRAHPRAARAARSTATGRVLVENRPSFNVVLHHRARARTSTTRCARLASRARASARRRSASGWRRRPAASARWW